MKNFSKFIILLTALAILVFLLAFPLYIMKKGFIFRKQESHAKVGEIVVSPVLSEGSRDGIIRLDVLFRTGVRGATEKISAFSFRLIYSTKNEGDFQIVAFDGTETEKISLNKVLVDYGGWRVPINKISRSEKEVVIDFAAVHAGFWGFSTPNLIPIATIYLVEGTLNESDLSNIEFEESDTVMYAKKAPIEDILKFSGSGIVSALE